MVRNGVVRDPVFDPVPPAVEIFLVSGEPVGQSQIVQVGHAVLDVDPFLVLVPPRDVAVLPAVGGAFDGQLVGEGTLGFLQRFPFEVGIEPPQVGHHFVAVFRTVHEPAVRPPAEKAEVAFRRFVVPLCLDGFFHLAQPRIVQVDAGEKGLFVGDAERLLGLRRSERHPKQRDERECPPDCAESAPAGGRCAGGGRFPTCRQGPLPGERRQGGLLSGEVRMREVGRAEKSADRSCGSGGDRGFHRRQTFGVFHKNNENIRVSANGCRNNTPPRPGRPNPETGARSERGEERGKAGVSCPRS